MDKIIPEIIKKVGFDFHWSEEKVWKLDVPVEEIDIKELEWHFELPFWHSTGHYSLKPIEVIEHPEKYKEEYERTMRSKTEYPLDIMKNKGRWLLLDGLHRLVKAKILGMKKVKVRKIPRSEIPNILK